MKFDIIMLQETHSIKKDERFWKAEWGGPLFFSHGVSNARGVAILLNKKLNASVLQVYDDDLGRRVSIVLEVEQMTFSFSSVYAPNDDDPEFFSEVFTFTEQLQGRRVISGDFNTVLNLEKDLRGGKGYSNQGSRDIINLYMKENELIDIW